MSMICRALCFCCYSSPSDPSTPTTRSPLLSPVRHSVNGNPRSNSHVSPPPTPDSAFGDGQTNEGKVSKSSPGKSVYGTVPVDKYA